MPLDLSRLGKLVSRPWVIAAWLFGSAQDGHVRPGSDVDIAVLAEPSPSLDQQLELQASLSAATQEEVDLVLLNGASSILRFEALQGRPIYCRDPEQRAIFASRTAREYEDDMALAERGLKARRSIKSGGNTHEVRPTPVSTAD